MHATIKALKNHIKINDWTGILKDFEGLVKQLEKASSVTSKEGIPKFFLKQARQHCSLHAAGVVF
jgi:hypothetical protein